MEKSNEEYFINWDETCILPEAHLITKESFNAHTNTLSYKDYFALFSNSSCSEGDDTSSHAKRLNRDNTLSENNNIFENVLVESSRVTTKYHLLCPQQQTSNILAVDRKFYNWFMRQTASSKTGKAPTGQNARKFQNLMMKIQQEQNEYQGFLRNSAQLNLNEYIFVKPEVKNLVLNHITKLMMHVLEDQHETYSLLKTINLQLADTSSNISFQFVKNVIKQTQIPTISVSALNKPLLTKMHPLKEEENIEVEKIEEVCMREEADVYMTGTSLVVIMESLVDVSCEFMIPVEIREIENSNGQKRKLIIFAHPLPRRQISTREINSVFYEDRLRESTGKNMSEDALNKDSDGLVPTKNVNLFQCESHKILIESNIDCFNPNSYQTYQISPKIEFQPSLGFEQFTLIDYCRSWWKSMVSNTDFILCTRIDPRNDCLVRVDTYPRDILCAPGCPYNPQSHFRYLNQFLTMLIDLNVTGNLLLEHAVGNGHLFLFQEKESGLTTVATKYKELLMKKRELYIETVFPWIPIDTNILPQQFMESREIPWLFDESKYKTGRGKNTARKGKFSNNKNGKNRGEFTPELIRLGKPVKHYGSKDDLDLF